MQHFPHFLSCSKKDKNATETQKKNGAVCGEGAVTDKRVKSGLGGFMLQISHWTMPHSQVDQLKLIAIKLRH